MLRCTADSYESQNVVQWLRFPLKRGKYILGSSTLLLATAPLPVVLVSGSDALNPLTTDDAFWGHQFLTACYQLVQSLLKIGGGWVHFSG